MKKLILTIVAAALSLTIASQTQAGPKSGGPSKSLPAKGKSVPNTKVTPIKTKPGSPLKVKPAAPVKVKDYHVQHGTKFQHGYLYKGKHHNHWGLIRFDVRYGCHCYWDPCVHVWFYWCERDICYYPVSYCPYRSYVCPVVVAQSAYEIADVETSDVTIRPDGVSTQSVAPPISDIPPIPEPVIPQ